MRYKLLRKKKNIVKPYVEVKMIVMVGIIYTTSSNQPTHQLTGEIRIQLHGKLIFSI